jgi:hypothetical protein
MNETQTNQALVQFLYSLQFQPKAGGIKQYELWMLFGFISFFTAAGLLVWIGVLIGVVP